MVLKRLRPARRTPTPQKVSKLLVATLLLGILSLFVERIPDPGMFVTVAIQIVDFAIFLLLTVEIVQAFRRSGGFRGLLRSDPFNTAFYAVFTVLFVVHKSLTFTGGDFAVERLPAVLVILRNIFVILKILGRVRKLAAFLRSITSHPARTVILSFALAILAGTILLAQPFATTDGSGLPLIDALFTSTSAVCVTGLIVVDTATAFTLLGKLIILILIQIGGLGIMILSYFVIFVFRRGFSVDDKLLISYMLSEKDMTNLGRSLLRIVYLTLAIEAVGAGLLIIGFGRRTGYSAETLLLGSFHAVSAFCNAGFALFTDSLEGFRTDPLINLTVCLLIISGGLSFAVLINLYHTSRDRLHNLLREKKRMAAVLSANSRIVLIGTGILLLSGMLFLYATEHGNTLFPLGTGAQYLAAFFQSVTLRTAGFNTIDMSSLATSSYFFMIILMFIGAATGSTAGGIKINTVAVLFSHIRASLREGQEANLFGFAISRDLIMRAFLALLFGITIVLLGCLCLTVSEDIPFPALLFESVSAFGTVGLSTGITGHLSAVGKIVVIFMMFFGRIGPLTLIAAVGGSAKKIPLEYPRGDIMLG